MTTHDLHQYSIALRDQRAQRIAALREEITAREAEMARLERDQVTIHAWVAMLQADESWKQLHVAEETPQNGQPAHEAVSLLHLSNKDLMLIALRQSQRALSDVEIVDYLRERGIITSTGVVNATLNKLVRKIGAEIERVSPRTYACTPQH